MGVAKSPHLRVVPTLASLSHFGGFLTPIQKHSHTQTHTQARNIFSSSSVSCGVLHIFPCVHGLTKPNNCARGFTLPCATTLSVCDVVRSYLHTWVSSLLARSLLMPCVCVCACECALAHTEATNKDRQIFGRDPPSCYVLVPSGGGRFECYKLELPPPSPPLCPSPGIFSLLLCVALLSPFLACSPRRLRYRY